MKIIINSLSKTFGSLQVFSDISFSIGAAEIVSIVGPSGCGKTTLLNILAELDLPDSGTIVNDNKKGPLGYLMQDDSLLEWRTLLENARLGNEVVYGKSNDVAHMLDYYFKVFELGDYKDLYPRMASAGMKQRVALVRTLLVKPNLILLDEPFSNLDFDIKLKIQQCILKYHYDHKSAILMVTHDIEDAIALSDKVIVLSDKPTRVKDEIDIDLGLAIRDPVEARKSPKLREFFIQIWDKLKYL